MRASLCRLHMPNAFGGKAGPEEFASHIFPQNVLAERMADYGGAMFLPGESPWTEKPGGLQSMGLHRVGMLEVVDSSPSNLDFNL